MRSERLQDPLKGPITPPLTTLSVKQSDLDTQNAKARVLRVLHRPSANDSARGAASEKNRCLGLVAAERRDGSRPRWSARRYLGRPTHGAPSGPTPSVHSRRAGRPDGSTNDLEPSAARTMSTLS
jgi:hypothetical protein